jgi:hypothetical protein
MIKGRSTTLSRRLERERRTLRAMLALFCRDRHDVGASPCPDCRKILDYALARLDRCPFGDRKPTCSRCPVHCYRPAMRERIRAIMRYAGPRMIVRHPLLALAHLSDARRRPPWNDELRD